MITVTISALDGGYIVEWYQDSMSCIPEPTRSGRNTRKVFVSLDKALAYAQGLIEQAEN